MTRHLSSVPPKAAHLTESPSLRFALMAAAKHAENGQWQAFITAVCDALWVQHEGRHEQLDDREMVLMLRAVAGLEWDPPTGTEREAA